MKGLWLLPTRRRLDILQRFLDAAINTGISTPGAILVNDKELVELQSEYEKLRLPDGWVVVSSPCDSIVETNRGALPLYKNLDWVGLLTDDVVPETKDWDRKLLESNDGKTIITCDDGGQAPKRMCGAHIFPVALFRAVGYLFPSGFYHTFVDDIWETLGRESGCWKVRMDVMVRHLHPWVTGIQDDTHKHSYNVERSRHDRQAYEEWKLYYKDRSIARLKAFLAKEKEPA